MLKRFAVEILSENITSDVYESTSWSRSLRALVNSQGLQILKDCVALRKDFPAFCDSSCRPVTTCSVAFQKTEERSDEFISTRRLTGQTTLTSCTADYIINTFKINAFSNYGVPEANGGHRYTSDGGGVV